MSVFLSRFEYGNRMEENPGYVIQNWMRNRNTVRFLGLWEHFHNPDFKYLEFEAIEREAGINRELIVLINLESMNAELIKLGLSRAERAIRLNKMAIEQLLVLNESDERKLQHG